MALGDFEVDLAMPWRNGHNTSAKLGVDGRVFDDRGRDWAVNPFGFEGVAVLVLRVTLIVRVHNDILIAKLSLGTCGTNLKGAVLKGVKFGLLFNVLNLYVRDVGF